MQNNPFSRFLIIVTALLAFALGAHLVVLKLMNKPLFDNRILLSYSLNWLLVVAVFGGLYALRHRYKNQLGFLFLGGSALKFAVFFIFFYPFYRRDGVLDQAEFATFFIPYALGLIVETTTLTKWLNRLK